ncbi:MAG: addiction module protein [Candidatus Acidiferrum sp.]
MTQRSLEILEKALALSEEERAQIAASLVQSLDDAVDEDAESAWQQEIANRAAEVDSGKAKSIPWEEVQRRISGHLASRRQKD